MSNTLKSMHDSPFFRNMPFVVIVKGVSFQNEETIESDTKRCKRLWFRVGNNRTFPVNENEIFDNNGSSELLYGFDSKKKLF